MTLCARVEFALPKLKNSCNLLLSYVTFLKTLVANFQMHQTILTTPLRLLFLFPLLLLIIAGFIIPSDGQHGVFSIKSLCFIATSLSLIFFYLCKASLNRHETNLFIFLLSSLGLLSTWLIIGLYNDNIPTSLVLDQFKMILLTLSTTFFCCYAVSSGLCTFQGLLKTVIYANFFYSCFKILLVTLQVLGVINIIPIVQTLGIRIMTMPIFGNLSRLQTSIDIGTPFLLFFFLQADLYGIKWKRTLKVVYPFVTFISLFFSFSRYLIFIGILSLLLHAFTQSRAARFKLLGFALLFSLGTVGMIGKDKIEQAMENRLFSRANKTSDDIRTEQIKALLETHQEAPLLGNGLGAYSPKRIRDEKLWHSYEVQWVALLMQVGWIGICLFLIPIGILFRQILSEPLSRPKYALAVLLLLWLVSGFTNPFLFSLSSGILYGLFYLTGLYLNQRENGQRTPRTSRTIR